MDDFFFREESSEVGGETDAYCSNCKADTLHTVVTVFEGDIRSVQCSICSATHNYRPPRGDQDDDGSDPVPTPRQVRPKRPWAQVMAETRGRSIPEYSPRARYVEGDVIHHSAFGVAYVADVIGEHKIEAVFEHGPRILVHGREDLPEPKQARQPGVDQRRVDQRLGQAAGAALAVAKPLPGDEHVRGPSAPTAVKKAASAARKAEGKSKAEERAQARAAVAVDVQSEISANDAAGGRRAAKGTSPKDLKTASQSPATGRARRASDAAPARARPSAARPAAKTRARRTEDTASKTKRAAVAKPAPARAVAARKVKAEKAVTPRNARVSSRAAQGKVAAAKAKRSEAAPRRTAEAERAGRRGRAEATKASSSGRAKSARGSSSVRRRSASAGKAARAKATRSRADRG